MLIVVAPPWSTQTWFTVIGAALFVALTIVSMTRAGTDSWGWIFWSAVFTIVVFALAVLLTPRGRSYGSSSLWSGRSWRSGRGATGSWCVALFLAGAAAANAQSYPSCPAEGTYVADTASLLEADDAAKIEETCVQLHRDHKVPVVVVTITSMKSCGASMWTSIESFATQLYNHYRTSRADWERGILVLVSKDDRKARIEPAPWWRNRFDGYARHALEQVITPQFRAGRFSTGLQAGVASIAGFVPRAIAGQSAPWSPGPGVVDYGGRLVCGIPILILVIIIVVVLSVLRMATRAISPWSGGMWGMPYGGYRPGGCLGGYRRSHWGGSSFGSRSFGGFRGGRGATGSW